MKPSIIIFVIVIFSNIGLAKDKLSVKGRFQLDAAFFDEDVTSMSNGTNVRRSSITLKGSMADFLPDNNLAKWNYKASYDFSENEVSVKDLSVSYTAPDSPILTIGHFKGPIGLENQMSSAGTFFMESALPAALLPGRAIGVGISKGSELGSYSLGYFGEEIDAKREEEDEGQGVIGRLTIVPYQNDSNNLLFHIGGSASWREIATGDNEFRYRTGPEIAINDQRFLSTPKLENVDNVITRGLELGASWNKSVVLFEFLDAKVKRKDLDDLNFQGGHLSGSYILWGPTRYYSSKEGSFSSISLGDRDRALELTWRFSWLDLNSLEVEGGEETNYGLGLNWHPNKLFRYSVNMILTRVDRYDIINQPNILGMRCQVIF
ncbi:MAG: hypothetical protein HON90_15975 [Halobacteriovoraceae bacterium]|jgi:phosphate-selective porin OprO and OprP|nr:hypothetical protein [Halobacteriovoraceae bacterium]